MRVNKKMKRGALRSALSDALASGKLAAVEGFGFDGPKTKEALKTLSALGLEGRVLVVLPEPDRDVEMSFRNLVNVKVTYAGSLSVYDVLYADRIVFTGAALDAVEGRATELAPEPAEEEVGAE
jgi:large subunit ribosomal protein L4